MKRPIKVVMMFILIFLLIFPASVLSSTPTNINKALYSSQASTGPIIGTFSFSKNYATDGTLFANALYFGLLKTTDKGATWSSINGNLNRETITTVATSPNYTNDNTVFAGTSEGMAKSIDGGSSWSMINNGLMVDEIGVITVTSIAVSPNYASDSTAFIDILFNLTERKMYKTTDGGNNWTEVAAPSSQTLITKLIVSPNYATDNTIYDYESLGSKIFKSTDGGSNWSTLTSVSSIESDIKSVAVSGSTIFVTAMLDKCIYKSTDGGVSWSKVAQGESYYGIDISPNYATDNTVFSAAALRGIYKSTNGGATWSATNSGLSEALSSSAYQITISPTFASDNTLFISTLLGIYVSTDGGATWRSVKLESSKPRTYAKNSKGVVASKAKTAQYLALYNKYKNLKAKTKNRKLRNRYNKLAKKYKSLYSKGKKGIASVKLKWLVREESIDSYMDDLANVTLKIQRRVNSKSRANKKARYLKLWKSYMNKANSTKNKNIKKRYQKSARKYRRAYINIKTVLYKTVDTEELYGETVNEWRNTTYNTKKRGTYRFLVYSEDMAGNSQQNIAKGSFTVR